VRPSPPRCDAVRHGRRHSHDTVPPTPVRLMRRALKRGRRSPRRGDRRLLHARTRLRRDIRLARPDTSIAIGPVRPSPPSQHHPGHCITISNTVGGRGNKTPPRQLLCAQRPLISRTLEANVRTTTKREASMPPHSKPFLDSYSALHDVPPEARFARTAFYSTALYGIPPHVAKTVRHDCQLLPPWPIKGVAVPQPQGGRQGACTRTLPAFAAILALASISTSGT
jgi:hypothetical protein